MAGIQKVDSLKDQIYTLIKNDIINQHYKGGDILNERAIAKKFGVSRTPVREALKVLEMENWLEYVPYKGIRVKKMDVKDLEDLFQVRKSLELLAVELSIKHIDDELINQLKENLQQQREVSADEKEEFLELDVQFHGILTNTADNSLLTRLLHQIRENMRQFGLNAILSSEGDRMSQTLEEHRLIIEALSEKNLEKSLLRMDEHIQNTYESACTYLNES